MKPVFWSPRQFWRPGGLLSAPPMAVCESFFWAFSLTVIKLCYLGCYVFLFLLLIIDSFSTSLFNFQREGPAQLIIIVPSGQSCFYLFDQTPSWAADGHGSAALDSDAHLGSSHWLSLTKLIAQSSSQCLHKY